MRLRSFVVNFVLAIGAVVMLLPFAWMLSLSVKQEHEIFTSQLHFIPHHWDWRNYVEAFTTGHVGTFLINGGIVTLSILALQILTIVPAAYVLARKDFRSKPVLIGVVLAVLLIPPQVTAIPVYLLIAEARLLDSYTALIVPFATSAFGIFLLHQGFKTLPQDLIDAARMDGASEFHTLWFILTPQLLPMIAAFGVFSIVAHWNDFFWPLLVHHPDRACHGAARYFDLRLGRGRQRCRTDDGLGDAYRHASDARIPDRAAPLHRRGHAVGSQGLTPFNLSLSDGDFV